MTTDTNQYLLHPYPDLPPTLAEAGDGRPVLVLHGGAATVAGIFDHFAATRQVLAPTRPGWEGTPRPDRFSRVGDLAGPPIRVPA